MFECFYEFYQLGQHVATVVDEYEVGSTKSDVLSGLPRHSLPHLFLSYPIALHGTSQSQFFRGCDQQQAVYGIAKPRFQQDGTLQSDITLLGCGPTQEVGLNGRMNDAIYRGSMVLRSKEVARHDGLAQPSRLVVNLVPQQGNKLLANLLGLDHEAAGFLVAVINRDAEV